MNIFSKKQTEYAWKNIITRGHLKELYCILKNGCGSSKLVENIPYTQEGVFACIDTEKPSQGDRYVRKYLSEEKRAYWDRLIEEGNK